jgi:hypothetical protein
LENGNVRHCKTWIHSFHFDWISVAAAVAAATAIAPAAACLPPTELPAPQGVAPVSLVGRFTLTVVVVKLASHCVFNKIIQNNLKE